MDATEAIAIRTENLAKTYQSGQTRITVFEGLNLSVAEGERLAILGESGAGKSSLLHLLGGLDRPSEGDVIFGDKRYSKLSDGELSALRNRDIGFVWQSHALLPEFSALENVMMPLLIRGVDSRQAAQRAFVKLAEVGLEARWRHRTGELSGGEQQRVALARALVTRPRLLLADEPTGNLDYKTGEAILGLLERLHGEHRFTSIIVTHNPAFARRCDRVLILDKGRLGTSSPPLPEWTPRQGTDGSNYV
ncbi:MAG: ABC transporter ATP-binding protein [Bryobacteraceae bacterium]|nr:ABC transporter ATP-binding protein [Bryobacteraceae bacterium]MDW8380388.1 ABC transporter ATP-binding protein [Bryobacterales bacterium]